MEVDHNLDLQQLMDIVKLWDAELTKLNLERFKLEAAIRAVSAEIQARIAKLQPNADSHK